MNDPPRPLTEEDIWFQIGHVYEQQKDVSVAFGCPSLRRNLSDPDSLAFSSSTRRKPLTAAFWSEIPTTPRCCSSWAGSSTNKVPATPVKRKRSSTWKSRSAQVSTFPV